MFSPLEYFSGLRDPRVARTREHVLEEILLIAIAAVLSGAESWNDIADYGESKQEWLKTFLALPGGIPSHDTFNRVFAALDPAEFERSFADWVASIAQLTAGEVVAIDGKTLCGTRQAGKSSLFIWFQPGPGPITWCWVNARSTTSRTKSLPSPSCSRLWS